MKGRVMYVALLMTALVISLCLPLTLSYCSNHIFAQLLVTFIANVSVK